MSGTEEGRLERRFAQLKSEQRAGLAAFITAGDPDVSTSAALLAALPGAGADVIELGMPFSDPVADGPVIQAAGLRALRAGAGMGRTLALVRGLREHDEDTPVVLMGYYNPILTYGVDRFLADAREAGTDGVIVVDLPPEEDAELRAPARTAGLRVIRLATPTTDEARLPKVLAGASGFLYYVSITGITGAAAPEIDSLSRAVSRLRRHTSLPVAVGFGIKTPQAAAAVARISDAVVVGSALVAKVAEGLEERDRAGPGLVDGVLGLVEELARGVREARRGKAAAEAGAVG